MAQNIQVTLPDGSKKEVPSGTTPLDIARSISPRLADAALVAKVKPSAISSQQSAPTADDGQQSADAAKTPGSMHAPAAKDGWQFADLSKPLEQDVDLRLLTDRDPDALYVYRHSSAHLLATAVLELFPETKLGHGPPTDTGFFYDFFRPTPFTPEDLEKIEKRMGEVAARDEKFEREFIPRNEGLARFRSEGDFMKVHFIEQFTKQGEPISTYRNGKFVDFCRGPHVPSTGRIKAFKLTSIAGAYWLGDEKNPQLQRIYGTSFFNKKDLEQHLHAIEEAKKRDHRVLGKQLDLFSIQELAGPGLIFWHPKGGLIRKEMEDWMRDEYLKRGYSLVYTPHVFRVNLWKTSGHEGHYAQNMFTPMELDDAEYRIKPMNCPGTYPHLCGFAEVVSRPARALGELGTVLSLRAVRRDARPACASAASPRTTPTSSARRSRLRGEMVGCIDFALAVLKTFGFTEFQVELSTWNPDDKKSFVGSEENWNLANQLAGKGAQGAENSVQNHSRRSGVLRAENRRQTGGCDWTSVAALDHSIRLQPARALQAGVRRGRWHAQAAL